MVAFSDSVNYAIYGDNPLANRVKTEDLKMIDYDRAMEMYQELFSNPGSFVFTFVGNINEEEVQPVIRAIPGLR